MMNAQSVTATIKACAKNVFHARLDSGLRCYPALLSATKKPIPLAVRLNSVVAMIP